MSARVLVAAVALAAAVPAQAYVRSCAASGSPCFYWPSRSVPWKLNPSRAAGSSPSCGPEDAIVAAAQASFAAWTQATRSGESEPCDDLALPYAGPTSSIAVGIGSSSEHIVVFRKGWCSDDPAARADPCWDDPDASCDNKFNCFEDTGDYSGGNTIALTTVSYVPSSGRIGDADIEMIDLEDGASGPVSGASQGWYFTCVDPAGLPTCTTYGQTGCVYMDLQNTLTHEAGHFVGLAHTPVQQATMYASAAAGAVDKRSLAEDDVNGVCAIYPPVQKAASSSSGCGAGGDPAALGGLLLVLAARVRRRR